MLMSAGDVSSHNSPDSVSGPLRRLQLVIPDTEICAPRRKRV